MGITIEGPGLGLAAVCVPILRSVPAWFGIEAAVEHYAEEIDRQPTFLGSDDGQVTGFVCVKRHTRWSAEVYVMGVRPELHRRGIGRALLDRAEGWLRDDGVEYLQVKTLGPSHLDAGYARTRAFYEARGFRPLEEFPLLWDADNPCLLMVKRL